MRLDLADSPACRTIAVLDDEVDAAPHRTDMEPRIDAEHESVELPQAAEPGRLPLGRLGGLAASGTFAVWTSLTCFVC